MTSASGTLRILQVDSVYGRGGAAAVTGALVRGLRARGHECWHAVGHAEKAPADVIRLDLQRPGIWSRIARRLTRARDNEGLEPFDFPASRTLLRLPPRRPEIVHCHNLHGGYFDLGYLPNLSRRVPTFVTLHDAWLLSGHCAHSFACERWRTGCGHCPDLTIPPAIAKDRTAENWARKAEIYRRSRLMVATPSGWLMGKVQASMLAPAIVEARVIPNGVDVQRFRPADDRRRVREKLGIATGDFVLVFAANGIRDNVWKDIATLRVALRGAAERWKFDKALRLLALGERAAPEPLGAAQIDFVPYVEDAERLADYYRAADVYIHAARADTFPNTVLEALSCGVAVVATAVGGIPEQVRSLSDAQETEATGVLVRPGDAEGMATAILRLAAEPAVLAKLGHNARADALRRFDAERQLDTYVEWYRSCVKSRDLHG